MTNVVSEGALNSTQSHFRLVIQQRKTSTFYNNEKDIVLPHHRPILMRFL